MHEVGFIDTTAMLETMWKKTKTQLHIRMLTFCKTRRNEWQFNTITNLILDYCYVERTTNVKLAVNNNGNALRCMNIVSMWVTIIQMCNINTLQDIWLLNIDYCFSCELCVTVNFQVRLFYFFLALCDLV